MNFHLSAIFYYFLFKKMCCYERLKSHTRLTNVASKCFEVSLAKLSSVKFNRQSTEYAYRKYICLYVLKIVFFSHCVKITIVNQNFSKKIDNVYHSFVILCRNSRRITVQYSFQTFKYCSEISVFN